MRPVHTFVGQGHRQLVAAGHTPIDTKPPSPGTLSNSQLQQLLLEHLRLEGALATVVTCSTGCSLRAPGRDRSAGLNAAPFLNQRPSCHCRNSERGGRCRKM